MAHAQITRKVLMAERIPKGTQPVFDLDLEPYHEVLDVHISALDLASRSDRKTVDWKCIVTTLSRHGEASTKEA